MRLSRPVLRYHGGKWLMAPKIIEHFPAHRQYIEPFGGGCSVLLRKPRSHSEVYNDRWQTVVNVFRVLRNPQKAARLAQLLRLTPFARDEFEQTGEIQLSKIADPVERARLTILRSFAGFGSAATNAKYATGFRAKSRRSGTTPAQDWMHYPDEIRHFTERLRGVVIENRPADRVIAAHDHEDSLFYVDPPYPHDTRNMQRGNAAYEYEMADADHEKLAEQLREIKGMAIVSSYPSELYQRIYRGWTCIEISALADGARERTECLWMSPNVPRSLLDLR